MAAISIDVSGEVIIQRWDLLERPVLRDERSVLLIDLVSYFEPKQDCRRRQADRLYLHGTEAEVRSFAKAILAALPAEAMSEP